MWMGIMSCGASIRMLNEEKGHRWYIISSVLYFGVCFVHERYMALLPLLLAALLFKKSRKAGEWAAALGAFGLVQLIRFFTIGSVLPAGTGGTQVADTFQPGGHSVPCSEPDRLYLWDQCGPEDIKRSSLGAKPLFHKALGASGGSGYWCSGRFFYLEGNTG